MRGCKLFIATPMYGGLCYGTYAKSIADLTSICTAYGIQVQLYFLSNESLITRARNYCSEVFMRSEGTHLMFIDSDIGFDAKDVLALMALTLDESKGYDIIGGPYPKKCIAWEKILHAVKMGEGVENPNDLEKFVGDYVFNPKAGNGTFKIDEPAEVLEIGTGFMMIPRRTFEKFRVAYPQYEFKPDHARMEGFDGSKNISMFFQAEICPDTQRYLSEDYWFTQKCIKAGMQVWLCPWMKMNHTGTYIFGGSLADLARINAAATVDVTKIKKKIQ